MCVSTKPNDIKHNHHTKMMRASKRSLRLDVDISDCLRHENSTGTISYFQLLFSLPPNGKQMP